MKRRMRRLGDLTDVLACLDVIIGPPLDLSASKSYENHVDLYRGRSCSRRSFLKERKRKRRTSSFHSWTSGTMCTSDSCCFKTLSSASVVLNMSLLRRTYVLLFCAVTFTMLLFSNTLGDPPFHFFKLALRLSDTFFSRGQCSYRRGFIQPEDDPWFSQHFNQSIHPLMSRDNCVLSEDTFKWWQWLQNERHPANFTEVVEELFQIIPDRSVYMDAGPGRCRTCAVVGNSGNLNGSNYGKVIDSYDFVIRMNQAVTSGFEDDVGSRTTHHVMYPESARDLDRHTNLVLVPFKTLDLQWVTSALSTGTIHETYVSVMPRIKANKDKVLIYNPTFFKYVAESWLDGHGRYPSTGFLSIMFAIHVCDVVGVFGFGADQYGNWHHYWEQNALAGAFRFTAVHDGDYEYNVTALLAEKHRIQLFKGR